MLARPNNSNAVPVSTKWRKVHKLDAAMVGAASQDAFTVGIGEAFAFGGAAMSIVSLAMTFGASWQVVGVSVSLGFAMVGVVGYRFTARYKETLPYTQEDEFNEVQQWQDVVRRSERLEAKQHSIRVVIEDKASGVSDVTEFPLSPVYLSRVALALGTGASFSRPSLCEQIGALSQGDFRKMQGWALSNELLMWRDADNPRQGTILTDRGEVFFGQLAKGVASEQDILSA